MIDISSKNPHTASRYKSSRLPSQRMLMKTALYVVVLCVGLAASRAGFGLGFERLLMFLAGVSNNRDVIPFARTPGSVEF